MLDQMRKTIEIAKESKVPYFAIRVQMDGFAEDEVIINPIENFDTKMAYYEKTYNEDGQHKHSSAIRIVACCYGESFDAIQEILEIE